MKRAMCLLVVVGVSAFVGAAGQVAHGDDGGQAKALCPCPRHACASALKDAKTEVRGIITITYDKPEKAKAIQDVVSNTGKDAAPSGCPSEAVACGKARKEASCHNHTPAADDHHEASSSKQEANFLIFED